MHEPFLKPTILYGIDLIEWRADDRERVSTSSERGLVAAVSTPSARPLTTTISRSTSALASKRVR